MNQRKGLKDFFNIKRQILKDAEIDGGPNKKLKSKNSNPAMVVDVDRPPSEEDVALRQALVIPKEHLRNLPSDDMSVKHLIDAYIPPIQTGFILIKSESCFSQSPSNAILDNLCSESVPPKTFVTRLLINIIFAIHSGYLHTGNNSMNLP